MTPVTTQVKLSLKPEWQHLVSEVVWVMALWMCRACLNPFFVHMCRCVNPPFFSLAPVLHQLFSFSLCLTQNFMHMCPFYRSITNSHILCSRRSQTQARVKPWVACFLKKAKAREPLQSQQPFTPNCSAFSLVSKLNSFVLMCANVLANLRRWLRNFFYVHARRETEKK